MGIEHLSEEERIILRVLEEMIEKNIISLKDISGFQDHPAS